MAMMMEIIDSRGFSEFCGVDSSNQIPDGDTIGWFRALLVMSSVNFAAWTPLARRFCTTITEKWPYLLGK